MPNTNTYYDTLGIGINATEQEIKKAYRNKVKKYHPDVNPTKEAEERIREITEAYDVLSDVEKRKAYDDNLKRNHKINFDEQPHTTQSNPYTSYSKERDESDFEEWIKSYLKKFRSMENMENFSSCIDLLNLTKEILFRNFTSHDFSSFSFKNSKSQSQYTHNEENPPKNKVLKKAQLQK